VANCRRTEAQILTANHPKRGEKSPPQKKLKRTDEKMQVFKIKAYKGKDGKKALCINGIVTSAELNAIKRKMKQMRLTVDNLPVEKWVEIALFKYDF
jgi:hypothetical protein